jgi:hypothetical protein
MRGRTAHGWCQGPVDCKHISHKIIVLVGSVGDLRARAIIEHDRLRTEPDVRHSRIQHASQFVSDGNSIVRVGGKCIGCLDPCVNRRRHNPTRSPALHVAAQSHMLWPGDRGTFDTPSPAIGKRGKAAFERRLGRIIADLARFRRPSAPVRPPRV